jgi:hypothetical protein
MLSFFFYILSCTLLCWVYITDNEFTRTNLYTSQWVGFDDTTLVMIGIDCTGSCKSNCHTITTTTVPVILLSLGCCLLSTMSVKLYIHEYRLRHVLVYFIRPTELVSSPFREIVHGSIGTDLVPMLPWTLSLNSP